jgi:hypothetical protein
MIYNHPKITAENLLIGRQHSNKYYERDMDSSSLGCRLLCGKLK